jgi:hypothetical protein
MGVHGNQEMAEFLSCYKKLSLRREKERGGERREKEKKSFLKSAWEARNLVAHA